MLRILNGEFKRILKQPIYKNMMFNKFHMLKKESLFSNNMTRSFCTNKEKKEDSEVKENTDSKEGNEKPKFEEIEKNANQSEDKNNTQEKTKEKQTRMKNFMKSLKILFFGKGVAVAETQTKPKQK